MLIRRKESIWAKTHIWTPHLSLKAIYFLEPGDRKLPSHHVKKKTGWHSNVRSELLSRILGFSASVALLLPEFSFMTCGKMTGTSCTSSWFAWFGMDLPTKNLMCRIQHVLIQRWALGSPKSCLKNSHVMCQKKGNTPAFLEVHNSHDSHVMCMFKNQRYSKMIHKLFRSHVMCKRTRLN